MGKLERASKKLFEVAQGQGKYKVEALYRSLRSHILFPYVCHYGLDNTGMSWLGDLQETLVLLEEVVYGRSGFELLYCHLMTCQSQPLEKTEETLTLKVLLFLCNSAGNLEETQHSSARAAKTLDV
jgi:hypothetical protein